MTLIKKMFNSLPEEKKKSKGFSDFFTTSGATEKKKIIKQAVRMSNEDQKKLVERYNVKYSRI